MLVFVGMVWNMALAWIWGCFLAAIIVQKESATRSQLLGGVSLPYRMAEM